MTFLLASFWQGIVILTAIFLLFTFSLFVVSALGDLPSFTKTIIEVTIARAYAFLDIFKTI